MKKTLIVIGIIFVGGLIWFAVSRTGPYQNPTLPNAPQNITAQPSEQIQTAKAPDFHLQDYSGKTVNFSDFAGKPMIINSWAAWCPFCRQELLDFAEAQKEFGDKVVIIAVDRAESLDVAKGYTDKQGTTGKLVFLLDPSDSFYQSIGGFSMPETIFVDQNGNIIDHKRGPMDLNEIRQRAQKILATAIAPVQSEAPFAENTVAYGESGFSPSILRVKVGSTVTFKNEESGPMWVASNPHPTHTAYSEFDAKRGYAKGESYSFTFIKVGAWKYHNHLSPGESGTITVE